MATLMPADRSASLPVEEYREMPEDYCEGEDDDDPMLQVSTVTVTQRYRWWILPEVVTFLFFLVIVMQTPVQQFWLFDHFSREYNWEKVNETVYCDNSSQDSNSSDADTEETVQSRTNKYIMYISFVSSFTAIFPTLFLGPMTDRFGRKFVFYISQFGTLASQLLMLMVFIYDLSPALFFVCSFIKGLSGSYGLFLSAAFGMVADITAPGKRRAFRVATLEASISIAFSCGTATSGVWVKQLGYVWPTAFSMGVCILSIMYTLFLIPETLIDDHNSPFSCTTLLKCFVFYVKDNPMQRRFKLIVCLICFLINVAAYSGEDNFSILYLLHQPFCWPKEQITIFTGVLSLLKWVLVMFLLLVGKRRISEPVFALIGAMSAMSYYLLKGLATSDVLIFVGSGTSLLTELLSPMCRTIMSKAVSPKEQGALFSGIGVLQMIMSAASAIVMSYIYSAGLGFFLGLPYLVLAGLMGISIVLFVILIIRIQRNPELGQPYSQDDAIIN